jgi:hypothetical protein
MIEKYLFAIIISNSSGAVAAPHRGQREEKSGKDHVGPLTLSR